MDKSMAILMQEEHNREESLVLLDLASPPPSHLTAGLPLKDLRTRWNNFKTIDLVILTVPYE